MPQVEQPSWEEVQYQIMEKALRDQAFHQELLTNSKAVLERELRTRGVAAHLPEDIEVKVIQQPTNSIYLVLPASPGDAASQATADNVSLALEQDGCTTRTTSLKCGGGRPCDTLW